MPAAFALKKPGDLAVGDIVVMLDPDSFTVPKHTPRYTVAAVDLLPGEQFRVTFKEPNSPVWEGHQDATIWAR